MEVRSIPHLIITLLFALTFLIPIDRILTRTGHSRWWCLIALVPGANLIALWVFAYDRWPAFDSDDKNPFKIGDRVVFSPSECMSEQMMSRFNPSFARVRLMPGDVGIVTHIEKDQYLCLDDGRGGFHWRNFKEAP